MLKDFRFRAETLLKLRKHREQSVQQRFARAAGEVVDIATRLGRLRDALTVHNEALNDMLRAGTDAMNLHLYRQCIGNIRRTIITETLRLEAAQDTLRRSQRQILQVLQQRKAPAAAKDRQAADHAALKRRMSAKEWNKLYAVSIAGEGPADRRAV